MRTSILFLETLLQQYNQWLNLFQSSKSTYFLKYCNKILILKICSPSHVSENNFYHLKSLWPITSHIGLLSWMKTQKFIETNLESQSHLSWKDLQDHQVQLCHNLLKLPSIWEQISYFHSEPKWLGFFVWTHEVTFKIIAVMTASKWITEVTLTFDIFQDFKMHILDHLWK